MCKPNPASPLWRKGIALEFTWGDQSGWHPHYHVLLVHNEHISANAIAAIHRHVRSRLAASCREFGLRDPDQLHAVRIDPNVSATAASTYIAKGDRWTPAEEMSRADLKTGRSGSRTPFQILADYYQSGDVRDRNLWHEFGYVTRGLAAVRWSRGLQHAMVGPEVEPERTDEELAANDVRGELIAVLPPDAWSRVRLAGLEHALLVAAERNGLAEVNSLIAHTGRGQDHSPATYIRVEPS